jgi:hypothetical protein
MSLKIWLPILLLAGCLSCRQDPEAASEDQQAAAATEIAFDAEKWRIKSGRNYPYRDSLLWSLIDDKSLRGLHIDEMQDLLGEPDRIDGNHLFYTVWQKRIVNFWPLRHKALVIKFSEEGPVEWMKIYE